MTTIRVQHTSRFTTISNEAVRDKRLSFKARGLHHLLLSYPDNWRINSEILAEQSDKDGKDSVRSALKELEDFQYLVRVKVKDAMGRFVHESMIFEHPQQIDEGEGDSGKSSAGKPAAGKSSAGKPGGNINTDLRKTVLNTPLYPPEGGGGLPEEPQGVEEATRPVGVKKARASKRKSLAELAEDCPESEQFEKFWLDYRKYCVENNYSAGSKIAAKGEWARQLNAAADYRQILKGFELFAEQKKKIGYGVPHASTFLGGKKDQPTPYWLTALEEAEVATAEVAPAWEPDPHRNPIARELKEVGLNAGYEVSFEQSDSGEWLLVSQDYLGRVKKQTFTAEVAEKSLKRCQEIINRNSMWHQQRNREVIQEDRFYMPTVQPGEWISTGTSIRQVVQVVRRGSYEVIVFANKDFAQLESVLPLKDCPYYPELAQVVSHVA